MKILHVSDIHYRESSENNVMLKGAISQFESLHPDYILITGDLTRDGRDEQFAYVRRFIDDLSFCHVLVIPGNRDAARTVTASMNDYKDLEYYLLTHPEPLVVLDELDSQEAENDKVRHTEKFFEHFENAEFFYRDSQIAATGLHSTPEITTRQMELASQHFTNGHPGELRIFCAHHSFLPVPTKKLKPGDTVPRSADILQTLIELNVDLLCCGHIHRSHVWDLSDGNHRLLCCNAGSLLDTSGKKDNGYLEIEIEHDLRITKRSLFTTQAEQLYHRHHFGAMLQARRQNAVIPSTISRTLLPVSRTPVPAEPTPDDERLKSKKTKSKK
ncbi:MAG TPA: metallophosphoesterase [Ktedonobacteraceae bacterium]